MNTSALTEHKPFPSTAALLDALQLEDNARRSIEDLFDELDSQPTVNHYVSKARITRSIVEGVAVRAVCGERFVVESQGEGRTDAAGAVVCLDCERLYGQMKAE